MSPAPLHPDVTLAKNETDQSIILTVNGKSVVLTASEWSYLIARPRLIKIEQL